MDMTGIPEEDRPRAMARVVELMRTRTRSELLRMAYVGGLATPAERWTREEIASCVAEQEYRRGDS